MFVQFIGEYLVDNNYLTKDQLHEIVEVQKSSRVKLGLIAVSEKMLTAAQADRINMLQSTMDKRFGDIAVEQGLLTDEQVSTLLSLQGNSYLKFIQTVVDKEYLTLDEIENIINEYKAANGFSFEDLEALKSGDIDRIIKVFVKTDNDYYNEYIALMIRNIVRFIDTNISFKAPIATKEYSTSSIATQCVKGDFDIFVGLCGNGNSLTCIANPYAKESYTEVDEDVFDAVCEFINCVNGLFASKLSNEDVDIDMLPPLSYNDVNVKADNNFYVVPIKVNTYEIDLVIGINSSIIVE